MVKTIKIADRRINYRVVNRGIKYPRLEFKTGGLVVILPEAARNDVQLVQKYQKWIASKTNYISNALNNIAKQKLILNRTASELKVIADKLICACSRELRVSPGKVFVRTMRSKWASLSAKRNITLNSLLKHLPYDMVAYIIYHELAHLLERRHSAGFWSIIRRKYKTPEKFESMLFKYWFLIKKHDAGIGKSKKFLGTRINR